MDLLEKNNIRYFSECRLSMKYLGRERRSVLQFPIIQFYIIPKRKTLFYMSNIWTKT